MFLPVYEELECHHSALTVKIHLAYQVLIVFRCSMFDVERMHGYGTQMATPGYWKRFFFVSGDAPHCIIEEATSFGPRVEDLPAHTQP